VLVGINLFIYYRGKQCNLRKKIFHCITSLSAGGVQSLLRNICTSDKEFDHVIFSLRTVDAETVVEWRDCKVFCFRDLYRKKLFGKILLELRGSTVIQGWMYHACLFSVILKCFFSKKHVIWAIHNGSLKESGAKRTTLLVNMIIRYFSYWVPEKIIYCGKHAANVHEKEGYDSKKTLIIYNGIKIDQKFQKWSPVANDSVSIGFIGRADPAKGLDIFVSALFAIEKKVNFALKIKICGPGILDDEYACRLLKDIKSDSITVTLDDYTDNPIDFIKNVDLILLPSRQEAFPVVMLEAALCSKPVLVTAVGDMPYFVNNEKFVVNPNDAVGLGRKLLDSFNIIRDTHYSSDLNAMIEDNYKRLVDYHNLDKMVFEYKKCWLGVE